VQIKRSIFIFIQKKKRYCIRMTALLDFAIKLFKQDPISDDVLFKQDLISLFKQFVFKN
jgi:hypothetical protein